ncbi:MAG: hypothetical protein K8L97_28400 [Anaerolineae bacterium]|nr:hypothetical protein [Anaerolineae bacterium]
MEQLRLLVFTILLILSFGLPVTAQDTAAEGEALELDETYTAENGSAAFDYPADWVIEVADQDEAGVVIVATAASSEDFIDVTAFNSDEAVPSGGVNIQFGVGTRQYFEDNLLGTNSDSGPVEFLESFMELITESADDITLSEVEGLEIGEWRAAQVRVKQGDQSDVFVLVVEYERDTIGLFAAVTAPDELDAWVPTIVAIAESVTFDAETPESTPEATAEAPIILDETRTLANGTELAFSADWSTRTLANFAIYLANTDAALNRTAQGTFQSGEVQLFVAVDTIANLTPTLNLGVAADADALEFLGAVMDLQDAIFEFDEPEELTVNDQPAALVTATARGLDALAYIVELENNVVAIVQLFAASGELEQWQPLARAVAESITFNS